MLDGINFSIEASQHGITGWITVSEFNVFFFFLCQSTGWFMEDPSYFFQPKLSLCAEIALTMKKSYYELMKKNCD
jgi:hypothetical protein